MKLLAPLIVFAAACGGDSQNAQLDAGPAADASPDDLACARAPLAADRDRFIVASRPFEGSMQSPTFEVFALSAAGQISATGTTFNLTRTFAGTIAFTADGAVGAAAGDDGSISAFTIDASGAVNITVAAQKFDFYASEVRPSPDGRRFYVIDGEFRNIGGGIYSLAVTCDGQLVNEGQVAPAQLPADITYLGDSGRALVPADDILDSGEGFELHLVDFGQSPPRWIAASPLFGPGDAIVSELAVSASGSYAVAGDYCGFCGPNRLAVATLAGDVLSATQIISFEDPYEIIASPFDDRMLIVSGFGDAVFELAPSAAGLDPYAAPTELTYVSTRPQLPGNAVMIERGALRGLVLLSENIGIRRIQFQDGASPIDLGRFDAVTIIGAIGVQP